MAHITSKPQSSVAPYLFRLVDLADNLSERYAATDGDALKLGEDARRHFASEADRLAVSAGTTLCQFLQHDPGAALFRAHICLLETLGDLLARWARYGDPVPPSMFRAIAESVEHIACAGINDAEAALESAADLEASLSDRPELLERLRRHTRDATDRLRAFVARYGPAVTSLF